MKATLKFLALSFLFAGLVACPLADGPDDGDEFMDVDSGVDDELLAIGADCRCAEEDCIADSVNCACQSDEGPCEAHLTCLGGENGECTHACEDESECPDRFVCSPLSVIDPITDDEHNFPGKWCLFGG